MEKDPLQHWRTPEISLQRVDLALDELERVLQETDITPVEIAKLEALPSEGEHVRADDELGVAEQLLHWIREL